ncbi:adenosylcobinamide-GDP ribazoletransferase [Ottowia sp.]|uniref:adenosylcobinamide-GDP ribazoletransferase n=1 Tax=Ottowia sp. TaxID=1898956 RepID=UPI003A86AF09
MQAVRHFLLALQFFTRIPVTGRLAAWAGYSPAMLQAASAYFPAVGWVVGAVGAAVMWAALHLLPAGPLGALVAALLATATTVGLTGAFHEDGLADTADGLGGSAPRERALQIMKDSRIGTYGAVALVLALGLKVALLALLAGAGSAQAVAALVIAHAASRLAPLVVMRCLPYVADPVHAKAKPIADAAPPGALWIAGGWTLPAAAVLAWAYGVVGLAVAALAWTLVLATMLRVLRRRLQGFTGDTLGATQQVCELALYLGLALSLS